MEMIINKLENKMALLNYLGINPLDPLSALPVVILLLLVLSSTNFKKSEDENDLS